MKRIRAVMLLAGAGLVSGTLPVAIAADDVSKEKMELAREVVELQRMREFFQLDWEAQKRTMLDSVPRENRNAQMKAWMSILRQQIVDGQTEAWVDAIAAEMDAASLRAAANVLESSGVQAWIANQLDAYPAFLEDRNERQKSAASVLADEVGGFDRRRKRMAEISPVGESRLGKALGLAPGARVDAAASKPYSMTYRFPVADGAIADVLPDLSAELFPGSKESAHVISISSSRAYASQSACEAARGKLIGLLSVHFPETDVSDCGTRTQLNAERTVQMRTRCQAQDTGSSVLLEIDITHLPTMEAAYGNMDAEPMPDGKADTR